MNKQELIEGILANLGRGDVSKAVVKDVLDATLATIKKGVKKDSIALVGFGTFRTQRRPARKGRNPQTGESMKIAAKTVVKFKPSSAWKV